MKQLAETLNALFPTLAFYWFGNQCLWVLHKVPQTNEGKAHLGYLTLLPHSPYWIPSEESYYGHKDGWEGTWRATIPTAIQELLQHKGLSPDLPSEAYAPAEEAFWAYLNDQPTS